MPNPLPGTVLLAEGEVRSVAVESNPTVFSAFLEGPSPELAEPWVSLPEPFLTVLDRLAAETLEHGNGRDCFNCGSPLGFVLDDEPPGSLIWHPLWLLAGPGEEVTVACEDCAEPCPIDAPVTVPETGEAPAPVQVKVITCPRVESTMTPCVARDGHAATAYDGMCTGCVHRPADLLRDLVRDHLDLQEKIQGDHALHEAVLLIALLLAKTGGRIEATPADLEAVDGTLHREDRPDGTLVLTLSSVAEPSPS